MPKCKFFNATRRAALLLPLLGFCIGCGRNERLPTARATGTVKLDGKPLSVGLVIFQPCGGQQLAKGRIRADGSFALGTYAESDGAIPGQHRVAVIAREELQADLPEDPLVPRVAPSLIPKFYTNSSKSGLSFEVKAGERNIYNIELSSSAKPAQP